MTISEIYQLFKKTNSVSTDTRKIEKDSVFFALKGASYNANEFATEALIKGASYVVIDDKAYSKADNRYILVDDVLKTLQDLASYHRQELGIPIIALTGSNGKTTTKELLYAVLSKKLKATATKGNLNNHIGVPLTLLSMTAKTEIGIVEMGANHFGEIADLAEIAKPNYGYITNFGKAHLEGFGSLEGVVKAKTELYNYLKSNNGLAFVNNFDEKQLAESKDQKRHCIGKNIKNIDSSDFVKVHFDGLDVNSNLLGSYNYSNIVAAIEIGQYFDVSSDKIKSALEIYVPSNKRSQLIEVSSTKIILDAYNANPTSMSAALSSFAANLGSKKMLILGDMFELGNSSELEHQQIANMATNSGFESVVLIGYNFFKTKKTNARRFKEFSDFEAVFKQKEYANASLLIKGSRGMELERVVDLFVKS